MRHQTLDVYYLTWFYRLLFFPKTGVTATRQWRT